MPVVAFCGLPVSIHASAREATSGHGLADDVLDPVSIHASAREATRPGASSGPRMPSFNPRLRTGGDCDRRWPARLKDLRV